jgi:hypothetical protein
MSLGSCDRVTGREGFLDHLALVVVQALELEKDAAAGKGPAFQNLVVLATTICVVDGVTTTDVLDGNPVPHVRI